MRRLGKIGKFAGTLALAFNMAALTASATPSHHKTNKMHKVSSAYKAPSASIVVDAETGAIMEQDNIDAPRHPASMTKIMTLILAFDALREGRLTMEQEISISRHAAAAETSKLYLRPGDRIRVADAIPAMAVHSANDVAIAMGEALGNGSEKNFAVLMNEKAKSLGMNHTTYVNASGLPAVEQMTTARDMVTLCQHLISDYPEFYHYFSQPEFTYRKTTYYNHNRLMTGHYKGPGGLKAYPGMDGLKTGLTTSSGANLAASAVRNGHRLIAIIFGSPHVLIRDQKMVTLLDQAFNAVLNQNLLTQKNNGPG